MKPQPVRFGGVTKRDTFVQSCFPAVISKVSLLVTPPALLVLAMFAAALPARAAGPFEMSFNADKQQVTIGDEIGVVIEVTHGTDVTLLPFDEKAKVGPFEIKRVEPLAASHKAGLIKEGFRVVLTVFELGDFKIPPLEVRFKNAKGEIAKVFTQEIPMRVLSVGRSARDGDDIRGLKGPLSLFGKLPVGKTLLWILLGLFLVAAAAFAAKKLFKKKSDAEWEASLPPYERALLRLGRLENENYVQTGQAKKYFTELDEVLQRYLIEQFQIGSEDLTTEEFTEHVEKSSFDSAIKSEIRGVMDLALLAKFAKVVPPQDESRAALRLARDIVEKTRPHEDLTPDVVRKGRG